MIQQQISVKAKVGEPNILWIGKSGRHYRTLRESFKDVPSNAYILPETLKKPKPYVYTDVEVQPTTATSTAANTITPTAPNNNKLFFIIGSVVAIFIIYKLID